MLQAGSQQKNKKAEHTLLLVSEVLASVLRPVSTGTLTSRNAFHLGRQQGQCHNSHLAEAREGECLAQAHTVASDRERPEISCPFLSMFTQSVAFPAHLSKLTPLATTAPATSTCRSAQSCPFKLMLPASHTAHGTLFSLLIILQVPETGKVSPEKPEAFLFSKDSE